MFTSSINIKQHSIKLIGVVAICVFAMWLHIPYVDAGLQYASSAQGATELLAYDWNKPVTESDRGFPKEQPPRANTDWTTPTNFAEGTLYFRAEIRNQPVAQEDMILQFCIWQANEAGTDNFALETCGAKRTVAGYAGNVVEWDQEINKMWKLDGVPLDWTRARYRAAVAVKRATQPGDFNAGWGADPPVSDFNFINSEGEPESYNWAGEDPTEWYPLDMRFTVVVVAKDETFSGWSNYVSTGPDTTPPVLLGNSPADGSNTVAQNANITLNLVDYGVGVDETTLDLKIETSTSSTITIPYNDSRITITGPATDLDITYDPSTNFDLNDVVTVTVSVQDDEGNVMPAESFTFTVTQVPDETPPAISNVQCIPSANQITIEWTTDELATSSVDYGKTNALELGNKSNANLKTEHSLVITGLSPQTTYHYQAYSEDASQNGANSSIMTCATIGPSTLQGDDFNYCALDTNRWSWIDPQAGTAGASTRVETQTGIEISVPSGISHDVYDNGIDAAHLAQFINDTDFEFDVKFDSEVLLENQMQGVIIKQDNNNFLRINFRHTGVKPVYEAYEISNGTAILSNDFRADATGTGPMFLRVRRLGDNYTIWISRDGTFSGGGRTIALENSLITSSIAIFAGNADPNPAFTSVVDYFFRTDAPITPEDGTAFDVDLVVSPVDTGTITQNISCGNPKILTAEPIPGWSFVNWSSTLGSVMTTTNPVEVAFPYNEVITANFEQNFYAVDASVNDGMDGMTGGTIDVSESPTEQGFEHNQLATVTATTTAGWKFDGWTGDVVDTNPMLTLVMTESYSITAMFSQIPYSVTVTVDGDGSVATDPTSGPFYLNQSVGLTATAAAGWTFAGWGGDLSGSASNESVTIDGNKSISALFTQDQYSLTVQTDGTGTGTVTLSPENETYIYGDIVTIAASADLGSTLTGWSGAGLTGSDASVTLTMEQSESVVATFARSYYTVTAGAAIGGEINLSAPTESGGYTYNEVVTVDATPALGYAFQNWTGALDSANASELLTVTSNQAIGAEFVREYYQVNIAHNEGGSVTVSDSDSSQGYIYDESVVLSAVPDSGYEFDGWSGTYGDNPTIVETLVGDLAIEATFKKIGAKSYVLNYNAGAGGSVGADPVRDGKSYIEGTTVTLTAVADEGFGFLNWTDGVGNILGTDGTFIVTMNGDKTIMANFVEGTYTASTSVVGNGVVNMSPLPGIQGFTYGTNLTLTATADDSWTFAGWEAADGTTMSTNPLTVTIVSNIVYTATFVEADNTVTGLSIAAEGKGEVEIEPNKAVYEDGEQLTLRALEFPGWRFVGWEVDGPLTSGSKTDSTIVVTAQNDLTVKALFEEAGFDLYLPFVY